MFASVHNIEAPAKSAICGYVYQPFCYDTYVQNGWHTYPRHINIEFIDTNVAATLMRCCIKIMCPLGNHSVTYSQFCYPTGGHVVCSFKISNSIPYF